MKEGKQSREERKSHSIWVRGVYWFALCVQLNDCSENPGKEHCVPKSSRTAQGNGANYPPPWRSQNGSHALFPGDTPQHTHFLAFSHTVMLLLI